MLVYKEHIPNILVIQEHQGFNYLFVFGIISISLVGLLFSGWLGGLGILCTVLYLLLSTRAQIIFDKQKNKLTYIRTSLVNSKVQEFLVGNLEKMVVINTHRRGGRVTLSFRVTKSEIFVVTKDGQHFKIYPSGLGINSISNEYVVIEALCKKIGIPFEYELINKEKEFYSNLRPNGLRLAADFLVILTITLILLYVITNEFIH